MLKFLRNHPYIVSYFLAFLIMFLIGIFALNVAWIEAFIGATVLSAVGVGGIWWKLEGFG